MHGTCYPYKPNRPDTSSTLTGKPPVSPQACSPDSSLIQSTGTIPFSSKYSLQCVKCSFPSHSPLRRTAKGEGCIAFNTLCLFIVYVNQSLLALCYTSPQHKDDMLTISIQRPDNGIRKTLPLVLPMAVRLILVYGQCRIQQQHPLFSPACKIARKLIGAVKAHPECIV